MPKNQIDYLVAEVNKPVDKLTVLLTSTHHFTDTNLCLTGHDFYNLDVPQFPIKWPQGHPVPSNMHFIKSIEELPWKPDVILSQNIVDQYNHFAQLAYYFDCPIIEFEHTVPTEEWMKFGTVDHINNVLANVRRLFITDFSRKEWKSGPNSDVIYHMVDSEKYSGWTGGNGRCMVLVNAFNTRKWAVGDPIEFMTKCDSIDLFGANPGFNSQHLAGHDVVRKMQEYDVFLNTSLRSPIPASVLEAASVGMPIVSTKTCAIPEFFKDGESILYFSTVDEAISHVNTLLKDKVLATKLGQGARKVILEKFNKDRYVSDWNRNFKEVIGEYHGK